MASGPFVLPQYQGSMYDLQRRQAMAQMLQQQSMESPAQELPQGMAVQPKVTGGAMLGKIAQMLMANKMSQGIGQDMNSFGQQQMNYLGPMMGGGQSPQPSAGSPDSAAGANASPTAAVQPGAVGTGGMAPVSGAGSAMGNAPLNPLHMDPRMAMMYYLSSPDEFMKTQSQAYTPTDAIKNNTWMGYTPDMARNAKIAEDMKNGEVQRTAGNQYVNYRTGVSGYTPKLPENAQINGVPAMNGSIPGGVSPVAGAQPIAKGNAYSGAIGAAAAKPATAFDANGNPVATNEAVMSGGGVPGSSSGQKMPLLPQLPVGTPDVVKGYAERHNSVISLANTAPQDIDALHKIADIAAQTKLGPGQASSQIWKQYVNLIPGVNIDNKDADNMAALKKYVSSMADQGLSVGTGSDSQLKNKLDALPHDGVPSGAIIRDLVPYLVAQKKAIIARANVGQAALAQSGNNPSVLGKVEQQWREAYDPRVYQLEGMSPDDRTKFVSSLSPQDAKLLQQKRQQLKGMGAL